VLSCNVLGLDQAFSSNFCFIKGMLICIVLVFLLKEAAPLKSSLIITGIPLNFLLVSKKLSVISGRSSPFKFFTSVFFVISLYISVES